MSKYKCLIVDDNMLDRDALEMHLRKMPQLDIVAACEDALQALDTIAKTEVDIVFSDVEMPDLNGFGLLKTLKRPPVFVFVSSHGAYAIESYDLDVIDFIVKPVTFERALKAVNKAVAQLEQQRTPTATEQGPGYFFIKESTDLVKLRYDEVTYAESMGDFSRLHTTDKKKHMPLVSLKNLELQLPATHFTRIHKQYIINHHHIAAIMTDEVKLSDNTILPLSHVYRPELLERIVNANLVTRHANK